jgi:hypothetical protein
MGRPRATTVPPTVEKRLPFFVLWFQRWKRDCDLKKVTVVSKRSGGRVQKEEVPRPGRAGASRSY